LIDESIFLALATVRFRVEEDGSRRCWKRGYGGVDPSCFPRSSVGEELL
jgi:hypothetical protein